VLGESETILLREFQKAEKNTPTVIFIDEIDSITLKREIASEVKRRITLQLLSMMDSIRSDADIYVLAATNKLDSIDESLHHVGRFDREIEIGIPDQVGRLEILRIHTKNMKLDDDVDDEMFGQSPQGSLIIWTTRLW
jgi:transitional endoplasmic reticulum ATPase